MHEPKNTTHKCSMSLIMADNCCNAKGKFPFALLHLTLFISTKQDSHKKLQSSDTQWINSCTQRSFLGFSVLHLISRWLIWFSMCPQNLSPFIQIFINKRKYFKLLNWFFHKHNQGRIRRLIIEPKLQHKIHELILSFILLRSTFGYRLRERVELPEHHRWSSWEWREKILTCWLLFAQTIIVFCHVLEWFMLWGKWEKISRLESIKIFWYQSNVSVAGAFTKINEIWSFSASSHKSSSESLCKFYQNAT